MIKDADISENQLLVSYGDKVCMNLLKDHTTQQNVYWATDSYADLGEDFTFLPQSRSTRSHPMFLMKAVSSQRNSIRCL